MISRNYFTFPLYLPRICRLFANWPLYVYNYLGRRRQPAEYRMRNGLKLVDGMGTLAGTIAVVFIRREYGALRQFRTIVDIGANMGTFAMYAAQNCPEAKIYCYEPVPRNFECLSNNIAINSLNGRVQAFQCAIASRGGSREMEIGASPLNSLVKSLNTGSRLSVNCATLKEICERQNIEKIDLLKMNCEGAEYEIFEECPAAYLARVARIRLEYHNLGSPDRSGEAMAGLLGKKGYRILRFTRYKSESGFIWAERA